MGKESRAPPRTPPSAFFYINIKNVIIVKGLHCPYIINRFFSLICINNITMKLACQLGYKALTKKYHTIVFKLLYSYGIIEPTCCLRCIKMKRLARPLISTAVLCLAVVLSLAALSPELVHAPGQNQVPTTIVVEQTTEQPEWYRYQVFVTNYGTKYHRAGCHYLRQSCYSIALINAINGGYEPCSFCHPPLPE